MTLLFYSTTVPSYADVDSGHSLSQYESCYYRYNEYLSEYEVNTVCSESKQDIFFRFFMYAHYSTLLRLPPFRFHCVGGCWDRAQDSCDFGIGSQTL